MGRVNYCITSNKTHATVLCTKNEGRMRRVLASLRAKDGDDAYQGWVVAGPSPTVKKYRGRA